MIDVIMEILTLILGNLFNLIYVLAFTVKDIMWLRIVMLTGGAIELYFDLKTSNLINFYWCLTLMIVNSVQVVILLKERSNLTFTEEEKKLHKTVFNNFSTVDVKKLLKSGEWFEVSESTNLINEGENIKNLILIYKGTAAVEANGKFIAYLRDGSFAGEMSFLTGMPTVARVYAVTPVKFISWEKSKLDSIMNKNPEIYSSLHQVFSSDLITKLQKSNFNS
jgi:hypothetical protein